MKDSQDDILAFWFEETSPPQWFQPDDAFDAAIRARFMDVYERAARGELDGWRDTARGCLALCILLDQFPRNMFRGTPRAFATDGKALGIARIAVESGFDQQLPVPQRFFIYLPFEHSETIDDQHESVALFEAIKEAEPVGYDYAVRHRDVIAQYGRFPHRNKILGRDNTPEEEAYLAQPGAGF